MGSTQEERHEPPRQQARQRHCPGRRPGSRAPVLRRGAGPGLEKGADVPFGDGNRWIEVAPPDADTPSRSALPSVQNPGARHYLDPRLEVLRKEIDAARKTPEALRADVDSLEAEAGFLADIEGLENEFQSNPVLLPHWPTFQPKIDEARLTLIGGKKAEADAARARIELDLNELLTRLMTDGKMGADETTAVAAKAAPGPGPSIQQTHDRAQRQSHTLGWPSRVLAFLAGISAPSAGVRYWFLRPLLWVALLSVLVLLGMQFLYVDKDTFGANGLWDYFGLFLWGLTADVAAGTLQQLPARSQ